jgi:drug/metabolite transporter (DMT)-like permease
MKKTFLHGIVAGILAAIAGIIYFNIYQKTLGTEFNKVVNIGSIAGVSVFACMIIALAYWLLEKFNKKNLEGWLNIIIALLSFASILSPISMSLPLDIKNPELFPGLVIPMHFFPALAYFCIAPFFMAAKSA